MERDNFPGEFATEAELIAPGLTQAFLAAAERVLHFGYTPSGDAIIKGGLKDLEGFEAIVSGSLDVLTPSEVKLREQQEIDLAIINGEYSEEYAEHLADNEDGYMAAKFLEAYVERVRSIPDWPRIARHSHREELLPYWLGSLAKETTSKTEEMAEAFTASHGGKYEDKLWFTLLKSWNPVYLDALVNRVVEGHADRSVRLSALTCLLEREPQQIATVSNALTAAGKQRRLIEIAIELGELRHGRSVVDGERHSHASNAGFSTLPPIYREITDAALALRKKSQPTLSNDGRDLVLGITDASEELRAFRVAMDRHINLPVSEDARLLLAETADPDVAVQAIEAAIRHRMFVEIKAALNHRFARVVACALTALAEPLPTPLPNTILDLATAKGSPVRRALVEVLDAKPHESHLPALLHLVKDHWPRRANYYGEENEYPIAQAAVRAIAKLGALATATANLLYKVAIDTADLSLRYELLQLLAVSGGHAARTRLLELACTPGRVVVRRAAAAALVATSDNIEDDLMVRITPELLAMGVESVATLLALLLSARGDPLRVAQAAGVLATNNKRRVLLVLLARGLAERDPEIAKGIADMLPAKQAAIALELTGNVTEELLADLGDPVIVAEVLRYLNPKND